MARMKPRSRSQKTSAKAEGSPVTETGSPPTQPDKKTPVPSVPLNKGEALQGLQQAIQKVKEGAETVTTWVAILDEWHSRLRVEWNNKPETLERPNYVS